jgi:mono/diheme cytochrome c family protein
MRTNLSTTCAVALAIGAFTFSSGRFASAARAQDGDDEPVRDGKWLYTRNCAGCHNDNGDGKGPTILQLGLTARDFKQGGFAFGDTPEQLFKTITTGIPGRSPMPSFKGVLSEEEIELVIGHVRTLMPERKDEAPKNTEMIVKDRPVIARGKLPPIAEGAPETIRGLLIGTPEGMTFEYDVNDVRLLGVRIGRFADREDWGGRGGGYVRPLGQLVWDSAQPLMDATGLVRVLASTWVKEGRAGITYEIREGSASGPRILVVHETVATVTTSVGPGWRMTRNHAWEPDMSVESVNKLDCVLPLPRKVKADAEVDASWNWTFEDRGERGIDAQLTDFHFDETSKSCTSRITTVRVAKWSAELAAQLEKELAK